MLYMCVFTYRTPPYRSSEIDIEIDVWLQLERPSDGATSPPIRFKYKPIERCEFLLPSFTQNTLLHEKLYKLSLQYTRLWINSVKINVLEFQNIPQVLMLYVKI